MYRKNRRILGPHWWSTWCGMKSWWLHFFCFSVYLSSCRSSPWLALTPRTAPILLRRGPGSGQRGRGRHVAVRAEQGPPDHDNVRHRKRGQRGADQRRAGTGRRAAAGPTARHRVCGCTAWLRTAKALTVNQLPNFAFYPWLFPRLRPWRRLRPFLLVLRLSLSRSLLSCTRSPAASRSRTGGSKRCRQTWFP
jgi:hypothetical protein